VYKRQVCVNLIGWIFRGFLVLYLLALAAWLIGTFGLFGNEKDPLSGIFLVLLGQPWTRLVDWLPQSLQLAGSVLAPALNLGVIYLIKKIRR